MMVTPIPLVDVCDEVSFRRHFERPRRPVVFRGMAADWPALREWELSKLARRFGETPVSVRTSRRDRQLFAGDPARAFVHHTMPLGAAIDSFADRQSPDLHYVQMLDFRKTMPSLASDVVDPMFVGKTHASPPYAWIAGPGVLNPLHWDCNHVLMAQIIGTKHYTLFAPSDGPRIAGWIDRMVWRTTKLDLDAIDIRAFPELAHATAYECALAPGDVLYLPYRWWHFMRALETTVSVSWWWEPSLLVHLRDAARERIAAKAKTLLRWASTH
jgi:[protein]-arginine 3-hydroxylase / protease